jgi:hypothetical protein
VVAKQELGRMYGTPRAAAAAARIIARLRKGPEPTEVMVVDPGTRRYATRKGRETGREPQ